MKTTGQRIKERREALGMSQDELAAKVGYQSRSAINKIETNPKREVKPTKLKEFASALQCSVPFLLGWEDQDPKELASILADSEIIEISKMYYKLNSMNREFVKGTIEMLIKKQENA